MVPTSKGGWLYFSEKELTEYTKNGNQIIRALEAYYEKKGCYPETLEELVPVYLKRTPPPSSRYEQPFNYFKIPEDHPRKDEYHYGFSLTLFASCWYEILSPRSGKLLVYHPSEKYPLRKWKKPKKLIGKWAYVVSYRSYGSPNPLIFKDGKPIFLGE